MRGSNYCTALYCTVLYCTALYTRFGLRVVGVASEDCGHGAKVLWVLPGGAAERAGLRVADKVSIIRAGSICGWSTVHCTEYFAHNILDED